MADWGAILWRIYTHIFYFTNRLLEQTTSMYIHMYVHTSPHGYVVYYVVLTYYMYCKHIDNINFGHKKVPIKILSTGLG